MAVLTGQPRSATLTAVTDGELVRLLRSGFDELARLYPEVASRLTADIGPRLRRTQLLRVWEELFGITEPAAFRELEEAVEWRRVSAGEVLIRQGEASDAMYVVVTGRFRTIVRGPDGADVAVRETGAFSTLGELGLLTEMPRSATVLALRDSEVIRLGRDVFRAFALRHPEALLKVASIVAERQMNGHAPRIRASAPAASTGGAHVRGPPADAVPRGGRPRAHARRTPRRPRGHARPRRGRLRRTPRTARRRRDSALRPPEPRRRRLAPRARGPHPAPPPRRGSGVDRLDRALPAPGRPDPPRRRRHRQPRAGRDRREARRAEAPRADRARPRPPRRDRGAARHVGVALRPGRRGPPPRPPREPPRRGAPRPPPRRPRRRPRPRRRRRSRRRPRRRDPRDRGGGDRRRPRRRREHGRRRRRRLRAPRLRGAARGAGRDVLRRRRRSTTGRSPSSP